MLCQYQLVFDIRLSWYSNTSSIEYWILSDIGRALTGSANPLNDKLTVYLISTLLVTEIYGIFYAHLTSCFKFYAHLTPCFF